MKLKFLLTGFILLFSGVNALEIEVNGAVNNPGLVDVKDSARVLDALIAAQPNSEAYFLGGMLLRQSKLHSQLLLKAGLLYDLESVKLSAVLNPSLLQTVDRLINTINLLEPTGRIPAEFNPGVLIVNLSKNIPLKSFDKIFIPPRPRGIYLLGAVARPGLYNFKNKGIVNIIKNTRRLHANPDWVWLIQPDSTIEKVGVALWNRQMEKVAAPGAIIFVPFIDKVFRFTGNFNQELAEFLASQNIAALGSVP